MARETTKSGRIQPSVSYKIDLLKRLQNRKMAEAYLAAAMEDEENPDVFLLAVRDVAEAHGMSMAKLAGSAGLHRVNLYRTLSSKGNPKMDSLNAILSAMGFKLTVKLKKRRSQFSLLRLKRAGTKWKCPALPTTNIPH